MQCPQLSAREFAAVGGQMSYGSDLAEACRQVGVYTGRILKGEKPSELPVVPDALRVGDQSRDRETLGIDSAPSLLARADEVIE